MKAGLGYALAAACLVWAFHDVKLEPLWRDAGRIEWPWMALAVVFDVLSYVCQGARWAVLLRRQGRITALQTTRAVYAGLFVNELLPLRVGEALRAWYESPMQPDVPKASCYGQADAISLTIEPAQELCDLFDVCFKMNGIFFRIQNCTQWRVD